MWDLGPDLVHGSVRDGECGVDPAVGVHHVLGDVRVHDAVDWVSYVLSRGHQETGHHQDHHRGLDKEFGK